MHKAASDLFQLLVHAGAVPGQDFSCDPSQQAYHLNDRCYTLLQAAYPEVEWEEIFGTPYAVVTQRIEALHQQLGCPFVDNITEQMQARMASLPDDEAAGYVQAILVGVESATDIGLYPFLAESLDMAGKARLEWLLRQEVVAIPGSHCLQDLIAAAGGTAADCDVHQNEAFLTEAGWKKLSRVWNGDCTLHALVHQGVSR